MRGTSLYHGALVDLHESVAAVVAQIFYWPKPPVDTHCAPSNNNWALSLAVS